MEVFDRPVLKIVSILFPKVVVSPVVLLIFPTLISDVCISFGSTGSSEVDNTVVLVAPLVFALWHSQEVRHGRGVCRIKLSLAGRGQGGVIRGWQRPKGVFVGWQRPRGVLVDRLNKEVHSGGV